MPTSVRLDAETEALLRSLAHRSGRTKSDVIREALHLLADERQADEADGPYALVADLVGIATGGHSDLARRHKNAIRERFRDPTHR